MKQVLAIVTAQLFGRESQDKHGKQAIMLVPVAGKIPNKNVLAGTIAERAGFEPGKSYLVSVRETEPSKEFGRQFAWQKVVDINSVLDIVNTSKELGEGAVYSVENELIETPESTKEKVA